MKLGDLFKKKVFEVGDKVTTKKGIFKGYVGTVSKKISDTQVEVKWTALKKKKELNKQLKKFEGKLPYDIDDVVKENRRFGDKGKIFHVKSDLKRVEVFWEDGTFQTVDIKTIKKK